jgi:hypothetical protein
MSDRFNLSVAIGHVLGTSRRCKNPQCCALVTSRASGSGRQREYCSTSCRKHYIYSLRTKPRKRLTCKNCGLRSALGLDCAEGETPEKDAGSLLVGL